MWGTSISVLFGFLKILEREFTIKLTAVLCCVNLMCASYPILISLVYKGVVAFMTSLNTVGRSTYQSQRRHHFCALMSPGNSRRAQKIHAWKKKKKLPPNQPAGVLINNVFVWTWVSLSGTLGEHIKDTSSATSGLQEKDEKVVQPQALLLQVIISCG